MVSTQQDMLGYEEAKPDSNTKIELVQEIAESGEAIVTFADGRTVEFHGDSSHFYPRRNAMFTETETPGGDDAESWFFADQIVSVQRH